MDVLIYFIVRQVATRERRAAESTFWRRAYSDDSGDTDFWKRVKIGSNNAFWKRDQLKSFWKRLNHDVETVEGDPLQDNERFDFDSDEEALKRNYGKSTDITFGKQQRRGHESSQRRPEFNPTGW
jgi:hypothetical protein